MDSSIPLPHAPSANRLLLVLAGALIFASMNATMFNVALPSIRTELGLQTSQAGWIVTSYMIVYAIGSVMYGRLADQYRLKDLLTVGLVLLAIGSLCGYFAGSFAWIVTARLIQAAGASVFPACAMIVPVRFFPPETRGRALGMTSAGLSFGVAVGPIIAGFLTTYLHWNDLFLLAMLPVLSLPFFRKYLQEEAGTRSKLDILGALLLGLTIATLLLMITNFSIVTAALTLLWLVLLIWRIHKTAVPFIMPSLFRNKYYCWGLLLFGCSSGIGFSLPYLTPLLFSEINGLTAFNSGLLMFPGALCAALLARAGGKLADRKGNAWTGYLALSFYLICFAGFTVLAGSNPYGIMLLLIFGYIAQSFFQLTMANTISRTLPPELSGTGMGLFMLVNFVFSSIATTVMGNWLNHEGTTSVASWMLNPAAVRYGEIYAVFVLVVIVMVAVYTWLQRATDSKSIR
ncbi:MFS transporter [Paenibacillus sp. WLX1005]|uniref:MFS transporter n=1 Tax=Paenibacillus sp. WLX1005 TaxID=3243766 RepID=UPI00398425DB